LFILIERKQPKIIVSSGTREHLKAKTRSIKMKQLNRTGSILDTDRYFTSTKQEADINDYW
jgi:hypothetical protein